jgi:hypothetical protein
MKNIRLRPYPVIIAVLSLTLVALLLSRFEFSVSTEPARVERPAPSREPIAIEPRESSQPLSTPIPPAPTPSVSPKSPASIAASPSLLYSGSLRISNQTDHPIRVALLPQQKSTASDPKAAVPEPRSHSGQLYGEPVQWDFAPQEGSGRGLRLSLPNGDLQIREGDVLVAFAQDGSRRYWGPFVVGKTTLPTWNAGTTEWQLTLQP